MNINKRIFPIIHRSGVYFNIKYVIINDYNAINIQ